jgi:YVTN family beta-propeller protein
MQPPNRAYVADYGANTVSVINTATNTVIATIPLGDDSPIAVAVDSSRARIYVTLHIPFGGTVSVIDTATNTVMATLTTGDGPFAVAVDLRRARVYVANIRSNDVSVINAYTNRVAPVRIPARDTPFAVAVDPSRARAYVANQDSQDVSVISTALPPFLAWLRARVVPWPRIPLRTKPDDVAVDPSRARAYVANYDAGTMSVINTATNTVIAEIRLRTRISDSPRAVAVDPSGARAYVTITGWPAAPPHRGADHVAVIDTNTNTVTARIPYAEQSALFASLLSHRQEVSVADGTPGPASRRPGRAGPPIWPRARRTEPARCPLRTSSRAGHSRFPARAPRAIYENQQARERTERNLSRDRD